MLTLAASLTISSMLAATPVTTASPAPSNPLLAPWTGLYGGLPPFEKVRVEHFKPAFDAAMAETQSAIDAITADPAPATFENTLLPLERSDRTLNRVGAIFEVYGSTLSTPEFQAVERDLAPRLAAFRDSITQNAKLWPRLEAVYAGRDTLKSGEQRRLAWLYQTSFARNGARLDAAGKKRVAEINERLATLYTEFSQNVLAEEGTEQVVIEEATRLVGLPESLRTSMAAAAGQKGLKGKWSVINTRSAVEPFLTYSAVRPLREQVFRMFTSRGDHGDSHDNKKAITEILTLRAEKTRLLGYASYPAWSLDDSMAHTPERAMELMEAVWPPAVARVHEEVADMQAIADREQAGITIEPWDYRYYAEKVRKARYDLDEEQVKPYLQLERLREGMFWVAGKLFDLHFKPAKGVPVYHPDVRVWEVTDGTGTLVGLWYFDPYARPGKHSGAWMNAYRNQERIDGDVKTIVSNNANFVKGQPGEPVLVSWIDATTLFHEFGHALHGLCSNVTYPSLSGTSVARDYVEFPSQLLERWLSTSEVLDRYARHVKTGKPMPAALVQKIEKASKFNQGFHTVEYLSSALVDMKAHLATAPVEPAAFERDTLAALGMPRELVMRHRMPQFNHIFSGDGYAAGYYAYLWSDTLSADAWEAFTEAKGPYDPAVAARLKKFVFSAGNTVDPAEGYKSFRGRDPGIGALMRHRGFPEPKK